MPTIILIENWRKVRFMGKMRLTGQVYGDPRFPDGEQITTSPIQREYKRTVYSHGAWRTRVRTLNTNYALGEPAKDAS